MELNIKIGAIKSEAVNVEASSIEIRFTENETASIQATYGAALTQFIPLFAQLMEKQNEINSRNEGSDCSGSTGDQV